MRIVLHYLLYKKCFVVSLDWDRFQRFHSVDRWADIGILRSMLWISYCSAKIIDGSFEDHFPEFKRPATRTHGCAERALD
jgi:sugar phosphate permease